MPWRVSSRISKRKDSIPMIYEIWQRHKDELRNTYVFTTEDDHSVN